MAVVIFRKLAERVIDRGSVILDEQLAIRLAPEERAAIMIVRMLAATPFRDSAPIFMPLPILVLEKPFAYFWSLVFQDMSPTTVSGRCLR
jgi:hypothetical protein